MFSGDQNSGDVNMSQQPEQPNPGTSSGPQPTKSHNGLLQCRMGQEVIHELVLRTGELFSMLKQFSPPLGPNSSDVETKKGKIKATLATIYLLFVKLKRCHDTVNEICSKSAYIQVKSLIPYSDDPEGVEQIQKHRRNISSDIPPELVKKRDELLEELAETDRRLQLITSGLRNFVYELNTMLAMSKK